MIVTEFTSADSERWERLVEAAPMATFLHTRRFLSYHGDRFKEASLLISDDRGALRAVLPAAVDSARPDRVTSHPGATFGGLVHDGTLYAEGVLEALRLAAEHYGHRGFKTLRYKPVPHIYHRAPSADDVWALRSLGASQPETALSVAIDLAGRRAPSVRRARSLKRARKAGVETAADVDPAEFWPVLEETLRRRHGVQPVHSLEEIALLRHRFPELIRTVTGCVDGAVAAGVTLFTSARVFHAQYIAASEQGMRISALDAVVERCLALAEDAEARYFDFGTSMRDRGTELERGLHRFKAEFGGGGVLYETYELDLASRWNES